MVNATDTLAGPRRASDARVIGLISAAHFVSHLHMLVLPPLFLFIQRDYGLSFAQLGLILASFNIVSAVLQAPAGFVVDRWGAGRLLIGGLLLGSAALAAASMTPSYIGLILCFALAGLANTIYHPSDYSILSHTIGGKRMGQAFSIHNFAGLLGTAAAPASMLLVAQVWGWHGALLGAGLVGAVVALVLIVQREALAVAPHHAARPRAAAEGHTGWRLLLSAPILRNLMFFLLVALVGGGINGFSIVALGALYGTPIETANFALSSYLFMSALGVLVGGYIADRTRHHTRVAAVGFAVSGAVILTVGVVHLATLPLVLLMGVGGLLYGIIQPSRDMIVRSVTPPGSFGKVFGFVSTGFNIGGVAAPLAYGWMMDQGEPRAVFLVVAAFTFLTLLTVATTPQRAPRAVPAE
ncbi:MAG TPA: MFS transporter [Stellaceae bacterium]|nr:MFS transporter [Stellaceae bacterium]